MKVLVARAVISRQQLLNRTGQTKSIVMQQPDVHRSRIAHCVAFKHISTAQTWFLSGQCLMNLTLMRLQVFEILHFISEIQDSAADESSHWSSHRITYASISGLVLLCMRHGCLSMSRNIVSFCTASGETSKARHLQTGRHAYTLHQIGFKCR